MSDSFEVKGSVSLIVEEEIERPKTWEIMNETGRRKHIVAQIDVDIPPEHEFVTEILKTAEEMFDE